MTSTKKTSKDNCKLCEGPKEDWQVYCGAACCSLWESGIRTKEAYDAFWKNGSRE